MNQSLLEQKEQALKRYPVLNPALIESSIKRISEMDQWDLYRINPLRFAQELGFEPGETVDFFVHGVKLGIFDFNWNMICPACGGIEYTHDSLNGISNQDKFHCTVCNMDVNADMDDQIEVSLTINPSIQELNINPFSDFKDYRNYYFSRNYQTQPEFMNFISSLFIGFHKVDPDDDLKILLNTEPGVTYRIINIQTHSQLFIHVSKTPSELPIIAEADLISNGFSPRELNVDYGKTAIVLHNRYRSPLTATVFKVNFEKMYELYRLHPPAKTPFLTGKMLLNNQSFRDLFRIQNLSRDLKLNVRSLTIMFTDLKGSTEMYDKAGDLQAYGLVQEHFKLLMGSVRKHNGAIIKTMGDAIMATFSNPLDGIRSAEEMMSAMKSMNQSWSEKGLEAGLKIGLNEGTALAVNNDERLDYFGQAVNIAARVQGLASAGEIWITDTVYQNHDVQNYLYQMNNALEKQSALLKGVGQPTIVYKLIQ